MCKQYLVTKTTEVCEANSQTNAKVCPLTTRLHFRLEVDQHFYQSLRLLTCFITPIGMQVLVTIVSLLFPNFDLYMKSV